MDAITTVPAPVNEPVRGYAPGSAERESLQRRIAELAGEKHELSQVIGGAHRMAGGDAFDVVQPHDHGHVLGVSAQATPQDGADAVAAAKQAAPAWRELPFDQPAAIFLRAAGLVGGPYRGTLHAAALLCQSGAA